MHRHLTISPAPIDEAALTSERQMSDGMGAAICFSGVVRGSEGADNIAGIDYESFDKMARYQCHRLFDQIEERWPIESIRLVHRTGVVKVNEPSLWVEVIAPHRAEAFDACQFLIDEMKKVVPIWKNIIKE